MPERSHLSIGEVLSLLREEFPDVTISKIRFLESQGLVDPERTPSGYRKFYEHDVDRLRWILRQQRENFLPLKVIRGRLTEQEDGEPVEGLPGADVAEVPVGAPLEAEAARTPHANKTTPSLFASLHAGQEAEKAPEPEVVPPSPPPPVRPPAPAPAPAASSRNHDEEAETYTAEELASSTGTDPALVQELKQYGLVVPHAVVAGVAYYDAGARDVVHAAAQFARHGVEARHLRPWRNSADREADLFQQVVLPLLRQRNPQARRQALETLSELSSAGAALRAALVERAVREIR